MLKIRTIVLLSVISLTVSFNLEAKLKNDQIKVVKVIVVIQDPIVNGKRIHETFKTPGYTFQWNDPWQLT